MMRGRRVGIDDKEEGQGDGVNAVEKMRHDTTRETGYGA